MKRTVKQLILVALVGLFVSGCAGNIIGKIVGTVAKPVFNLVDRDAESANAWIEAEVTAGRLSEADAVLAKQCPDAVLALSAIRKELVAGSEDVERFKGVIYHAVKTRFGQSVQVDIARHIQTIAGRCAELIPVDKLLLVFGGA